MVTFVLDASAVLRFLDHEVGADRVEKVLNQHYSSSAEALISAMHWGEIVGVFHKRHGTENALDNIRRLRALQLIIIPVTGERAERCAKVKVELRIPYVDALAVELAMTIPECILITADFDLKPAEDLVTIEFLPPKPLTKVR